MRSAPSSRAAFASVVIALLATPSCQKPRPAWPDAGNGDFINATLTPGTTQVSQQLSEMVQVQPNQLVFPMSDATAVAMKWPVGKPVVGNRSMGGNSGNPLGFLRKVMGVSSDGTNITVQTQPAALADVVTGSGHMTMDPIQGMPITVDAATQALVFPSYPSGSTSPAMTSHTRGSPITYGTSSQALHDNLTINETFTPGEPISWQIFNVNDTKSYTNNGNNSEVSFKGSATLTANFSFTPSLVLAFDTTLGTLETFDGEANGQLDMSGELNIDVDVSVLNSTNTSDLSGLAGLITNGPDLGSLPTVTLYESTPVEGPDIIGIPTTFQFQLLLDCSFSISGSMSADLTGNLSGNVNAGVTYDKKHGGWMTPANITFNPTQSGTVNGGGGVMVGCGLSPRILWSFADVGGPYIDVRGGVVATNTVTQPCPGNGPVDVPPDVVDSAELDATFDIQYGGEIDALDGALSFGVGPYDVWSNQWKVWTDTFTFPRSGIGQCVVQCQDGSKDGSETDVDCGGPVCLACGQNKKCGGNSDCISDICSNSGICQGSECTDGRKDGNETDIDCGGGTCPACFANKSCLVNSDCNDSVCSSALYGPKVCTDDLCIDGVKDGSEPDVDCGNIPGCTKLCSNGQGCFSNADCTSSACDLVTSMCVANICSDQRQDGNETDIDCGGSCSTQCAVGRKCLFWDSPSDCASGFCNVFSNICVANIHEDGVTNGGETGVDCGGAAPNLCGIGSGCDSTSDCATGGVCDPYTRVCAVIGCHDGIQDLAETSPDCGGGTCVACGLGKGCKVSSDCSSNICSAAGVCVVSACSDGKQDNGETDVDCGHVCGSITCPSGEHCTVASDCASNICVGGTCTSDPCKDGVRDGSETDVDCGGNVCAARCNTGGDCVLGTDCGSGLCSALTNKCVAGECSDGVKDGTETDVDCGGSCSTKCAVNKDCLGSADCASNICNLVTHICAATTCFDGVKDGTETDVDCGGSCPEKCTKGEDCDINADCQSGACITTASPATCAADQCSDGIQDGNETGLDCGGSCPTGCGVGAGCLTGADCANPQNLVGVAGYCDVTANVCDPTSCTDGVMDGTETGLDCGGSCSLCPVGQGCNTGADCSSTFCNIDSKLCVATQCQDGIKNGTETDIDCGGGTCGYCQQGQGCENGGQDCAPGYCTSGLCSPALPQTCYSIWYNYMAANGVAPNDAMYTLDLDGPDRPNSGPGTGADSPISTFCDMTNGGWTPVQYLNSNSVADAKVVLGTQARTTAEGLYNWDVDRDSWEGYPNQYTCTTTADCLSDYPSGPPSLTCKNPSGGDETGFCINGDAYTFQGLPGAPGVYSDSTPAQAPPESYVMNVLSSGDNYLQGRVDVWRNQVLLWSTPIFSWRSFRQGPPSSGYYYTPSQGSDMLWLKCYSSLTGGAEANPISPWSDMYSTLESGLNAACHGWAVYAGAYDAQTSDTAGGTQSVLNIFQEETGIRNQGYPFQYAYSKSDRVSIPDEHTMWGLWVRFGSVANGAIDYDTQTINMGTCNTIGACWETPANGADSLAGGQNGLVHRKASANNANGGPYPIPPIGNNPDELTNPLSGTEIPYGTDGLVFVWWGQ